MAATRRGIALIDIWPPVARAREPRLRYAASAEGVALLLREINGKSRARDRAPATREDMLCRGVGLSRRAACAREGGPELQMKTASPLPDPSVLVLMGVSGC